MDASYLEKYYNKQFKSVGDPEFSQLNNRQIKIIENTLGFNTFKLNETILDFIEDRNNDIKMWNRNRLIDKILK